MSAINPAELQADWLVPSAVRPQMKEHQDSGKPPSWVRLQIQKVSGVKGPAPWSFSEQERANQLTALTSGG